MKIDWLDIADHTAQVLMYENSALNKIEMCMQKIIIYDVGLTLLFYACDALDVKPTI